MKEEITHLRHGSGNRQKLLILLRFLQYLFICRRVKVSEFYLPVTKG